MRVQPSRVEYVGKAGTTKPYSTSSPVPRSRCVLDMLAPKRQTDSPFAISDVSKFWPNTSVWSSEVSSPMASGWIVTIISLAPCTKAKSVSLYTPSERFLLNTEFPLTMMLTLESSVSVMVCEYWLGIALPVP